MNKEFEQLKKIEEILARFSMKDGAFLSTWNEKTGAYTVSFEGSDLLEELKPHLISSDEIKREVLVEIMDKIYDEYRKDTAWHDFYFRGMEMMISGVKRYLTQQSLDGGDRDE